MKNGPSENLNRIPKSSAHLIFFLFLFFGVFTTTAEDRLSSSSDIEATSLKIGNRIRELSMDITNPETAAEKKNRREVERRLHRQMLLTERKKKRIHQSSERFRAQEIGRRIGKLQKLTGNKKNRSIPNTGWSEEKEIGRKIKVRLSELGIRKAKALQRSGESGTQAISRRVETLIKMSAVKKVGALENEWILKTAAIADRIKLRIDERTRYLTVISRKNRELWSDNPGQGPLESVKGLMMNVYGFPNWSKSVEKEIIHPRSLFNWIHEDSASDIRLQEETERDRSDILVLLKSGRKTKTTPVLFPHRTHTYWHQCESCHPNIFPKERSEIKLSSMRKIKKGRFCGRCHGTVVFPPKNCKLCHIDRKSYRQARRRGETK